MGKVVKRFAVAVDEWRMAPLIAMALLPALVLRCKNVLVDAEYAAMADSFYVVDVMSWWKSVLVLGVALWMGVHILLRLLSGWRPRFDFFSAACLLAAVCVVLSILASSYPVASRWGVANQYEGGVATLSYLVALWYAGVMLSGDGERLLLIRLIGAVALVNAAIGIGQGLGCDFWQSAPGLRIMGGGDMPVHFSFARAKLAYGTFYQPNHYGLFMAMATVLAANALFAETRKRYRLYWILVFSASLLGVIFSQSRAAMGVVGICFAVRLFFSIRSIVLVRNEGAIRALKEILRRHRQFVLAAFGMVALAVVSTLLLLGPEQVYRITIAQLERTISDLDRVTVDSDLDKVELRDNRIEIKLRDREIALRPAGADAGWFVEGPKGTVAPLPIGDAGGPEARYGLAGHPGFSLLERKDGRIEFAWDDVRLRFFRNGGEVFVIDGQDGMHAEMRTADAVPTAGFDRVLGGRVYIWSRALPLVVAAPFLGSGPGTFALVFPNLNLVDAQRFFFANVIENKAHGLWVALLVQLGVCGFLAFGLLFAYCLFTAIDSGPILAKPLAYGMLAWGLGSLTNDSTVGTTPVISVLCGISVSAFSERHKGEGWTEFIRTIFGPGKYYPLVKRCLDILLVVASLPLSVPLALAAALFIRLDSPGGALFAQQRFGKHRRPFLIYKFRTMQETTPNDTPTFLLSNPTSHITRAGKLLRRFSLDELPQLYNVLKGDLSLIGPRPVLLRETRLVNERDKYGANDIPPGITGWAQINGRDFLPAPIKAKYDGEYVRNMSLWLDVRILFWTIPIVIWGKGVREGRRSPRKPGR